MTSVQISRQLKGRGLPGCGKTFSDLEFLWPFNSSLNSTPHDLPRHYLFEIHSKNLENTRKLFFGNDHRLHQNYHIYGKLFLCCLQTISVAS